MVVQLSWLRQRRGERASRPAVRSHQQAVSSLVPFSKPSVNEKYLVDVGQIVNGWNIFE